MKQIIEENYQVTVDRGLIKENTTKNTFYSKLEEEIDEFRFEYFYDGKIENQKKELADIILVCLNIAAHNGWDIEQQLKENIKRNAKRASNV